MTIRHCPNCKRQLERHDTITRVYVPGPYQLPNGAEYRLHREDQVHVSYYCPHCAVMRNRPMLECDVLASPKVEQMEMFGGEA